MKIWGSTADNRCGIINQKPQPSKEKIWLVCVSVTLSINRAFIHYHLSCCVASQSFSHISHPSQPCCASLHSSPRATSVCPCLCVCHVGPCSCTLAPPSPAFDKPLPALTPVRKVERDVGRSRVNVRITMQVCVFISLSLLEPVAPPRHSHAHPPTDPSHSALVGCHGYSVASLPHVAMRLGPTDLSWMTMWLWQEAHNNQ